MTIKLINFWNIPDNYGAVLTAYALQCVVSSFNEKSLLVDNLKKIQYRNRKYSTTTFAKNKLQTTDKVFLNIA